jgi:hypothetical protein
MDFFRSSNHNAKQLLPFSAQKSKIDQILRTEMAEAVKSYVSVK